MNDHTLIHPTTKKQLDMFIRSGSSTLALVGPAGAGKTFLAEYVAKQVIGDIRFNSIIIESKDSGIEQIRELQKDLGLIVPGDQKLRRLVIINDFDHLGHEAQNALLKTLEEPPIDTLLIITVNRQQKVLETIFSRLHKIVVKPITKSDIERSYNKTQAENVNKYYILSLGYAGLFSSLMQGSDHPTLSSIDYAKKTLTMSKSSQIAEVDKLVKSKNQNMVDEFLDAVIRIFYTSFRLTLSSGRASQRSSALRRLKIAYDTTDMIEKGVGKKLALTRMFYKI